LALKITEVEAVIVEEDFMQGSGEAQVNGLIYIKLWGGAVWLLLSTVCRNAKGSKENKERTGGSFKG